MGMLRLVSAVREYVKFRRAGEFVRRFKFDAAADILDGLIEKSPETAAYHILRADVWLYQSELGAAMAVYDRAQELIPACRFSNEDRRFLNAYVNFRKMTIERELNGEIFPGWQGLAKTINDLPAKKMFKQALRLRQH